MKGQTALEKKKKKSKPLTTNSHISSLFSSPTPPLLRQQLRARIRCSSPRYTEQLDPQTMKGTTKMTTTTTTLTTTPTMLVQAAAPSTLLGRRRPATAATSSPPPPIPRFARSPRSAAARSIQALKMPPRTEKQRSLVVAAASSSSSASSSPSSPPPPRGGPPPPRPGALPFDTPLAIALAGAAFEAYNSPAGFEVDPKSGRDFAFVDADGTRTHYLNPNVLAAASCGGVVASVKVSRAVGLPASDAWGTSDPYFLAELKGRASAHQSAVVSRDCSPVFDDEFELFVGRGAGGDSNKADDDEGEDPLDSVLKVSFFDSDALTADDALGSAEISLRELSEKGGEEVELKLLSLGSDEGGGGRSKSAGSVFLSGSVRTLSQPELESRASGSILPDGTDEVARMSRAWRSLAAAAAGGGDRGKDGSDGADAPPADSIFEPAAFIENPASDTQLWVGIDSARRRLMLAFRGTETTKM